MNKLARILVVCVLLPFPVYAQQIGASITGRVLDPSAAAVVGATIKVTSTTTGAVYTAGSSDAGIYQLPFVRIGTYTLTAEKQGFKKYIQEGVGLTVGQKAVIDITLQLGAVTQSVSVVANAPMLQPESADRNWTIGQVRLEPEVFRGQNTIETTWLAPGVTITQGVQKIRPWDNAGTAGESINGGQAGQGGNLQTGQTSGNQVMVDGISSNRGGNGTGFNPIASTVQEVNVQGTMYDARYGWSTGGHINTITKGGTNAWHGHAYDYLQNTRLNATDWTSLIPKPGFPKGTGRLPWHINMFGGEIGGPILKNKLFVYYAIQYIWQVQRDPFTAQVPTAAMRQGNFNGVLTTGGAQIQLYDPSTTGSAALGLPACSANSAVACRSQSGPLVSGNQVLQINPIAAKILSFIPLPNTVGNTAACPTGVSAPVCGTFASNLVTGPQSRKFVDFFPEHSGRVDYNLSDKTVAFFRFSKNDLDETRSYIYDTVSANTPAETSGNNPLFRGNQAYAFQVTHTFNPTTVLEFRHGMDRYPNGGGNIGTGKGFDPSTLGFSSTFAGQAARFFPQINVTSMGNLSSGQMASGSPPSYTASDIWTTEVVAAHTRGQHNLRAGFQNFILGEYSEGPGNINGFFNFNGYFTNLNPLGSIGTTGYGLADFELGYPISATINVPAWPQVFVREFSVFAQDDYHLSRKFTLNFGLRWDYAGPASDKYNRLLNGFCTTCQSPLQIPGGVVNGVAVPGMNLVGGPTFAGNNGAPNGIFHRKFDNFGPRVGFAYNAGHDTVVRGGFGIIYAQQIEYVGAAPGYSVSPSFNPTITDGIPNPAYTFANPFPTGLPALAGNRWGLATNIGAGINFPDPDMDIPRTMQYSLEVQKGFGHNWLVSLAYVGSNSQRLNVNQPINFLPWADLPFTPSGAPNPNGYSASALTKQVPNPFRTLPATSPYYSYLKGNNSSYLNSTISQQQLLLPYPQFGGLTEYYVPIGRSHYNSLQFEVNKRLSMGLEFSANLTWSKTLQATGFLNSQDPQPAQTIAPFDVTKQAKINLTYQLPFGPGRQFLANTNPVLNRIVGGWTINAVARLMDGFPMRMPTASVGNTTGGLMPIPGASQKTPNPTLSHYFNTCTYTAPTAQYPNGQEYANTCHGVDTTPAWRLMSPFQLYEWSPYLSQIHMPGVHRVDAGIMKDTAIKERYKLRFRCDFVNAFNSAEWVNVTPGLTAGSSTWGFVGPGANTPSDDPRVIMMSLQFLF